MNVKQQINDSKDGIKFITLTAIFIGIISFIESYSIYTSLGVYETPITLSILDGMVSTLTGITAGLAAITLLHFKNTRISLEKT